VAAALAELSEVATRAVEAADPRIAAAVEDRRAAPG
jgi:hypothetical protein